MDFTFLPSIEYMPWSRKQSFNQSIDSSCPDAEATREKSIVVREVFLLLLRSSYAAIVLLPK